MIKNLMLDLVGVLMRYDTLGYCRAHGIGDGDFALLEREVLRSLEWAMQDRGTLDDEAALTAIRARLPRRLHGAARDFIRRENRAILPVEGMTALLEEMKGRGMRLWLLSNTSAAFHRIEGQIPGLALFDGAMISADVGLVKPDPAIFRLACRRFDLRPEETAFIDDTPINAEAALYVGMRAFVFNGDVPALRAWLEGSVL